MPSCTKLLLRVFSRSRPERSGQRLHESCEHGVAQNVAHIHVQDFLVDVFVSTFASATAACVVAGAVTGSGM